MGITTWIFEPEEVEAAIELYMVEEQGVPLDDMQIIKFLITDTEKGPVFDGVQVSFEERENEM